MPSRREPVAEPTALDMICQFNKLKPPRFGGGIDPLACEEWLRRMENLLEVMDYPEGFKVRLATHQFEKEAELVGDCQTPSWRTGFDLGAAEDYDGCLILSSGHEKG